MHMKVRKSLQQHRGDMGIGMDVGHCVGFLQRGPGGWAQGRSQQEWLQIRCMAAKRGWDAAASLVDLWAVVKCGWALW
jgi:hypothetical protein